VGPLELRMPMPEIARPAGPDGGAFFVTPGPRSAVPGLSAA
jgi:hypothetical protein